MYYTALGKVLSNSPNLNRKERKDRYARNARATHPLETYETKDA